MDRGCSAAAKVESGGITFKQIDWLCDRSLPRLSRSEYEATSVDRSHGDALKFVPLAAVRGDTSRRLEDPLYSDHRKSRRTADTGMHASGARIPYEDPLSLPSSPRLSLASPRSRPPWHSVPEFPFASSPPRDVETTGSIGGRANTQVPFYGACPMSSASEGNANQQKLPSSSSTARPPAATLLTDAATDDPGPMTPTERTRDERHEASAPVSYG